VARVSPGPLILKRLLLQSAIIGNTVNDTSALIFIVILASSALKANPSTFTRIPHVYQNQLFLPAIKPGLERWRAPTSAFSSPAIHLIHILNFVLTTARYLSPSASQSVEAHVRVRHLLPCHIQKQLEELAMMPHRSSSWTDVSPSEPTPKNSAAPMLSLERISVARRREGKTVIPRLSILRRPQCREIANDIPVYGRSTLLLAQPLWLTCMELPGAFDSFVMTLASF
jgi:hypothetical protein